MNLRASARRTPEPQGTETDAGRWRKMWDIHTARLRAVGVASDTMTNQFDVEGGELMKHRVVDKEAVKRAVVRATKASAP